MRNNNVHPIFQGVINSMSEPSMKDISSKIVRRYEEQRKMKLKQLSHNIDKLKAERNSALHDLEMHKESCIHCEKKTTEELSAAFGCYLGAIYAKTYQQKSRVLRGT